MAKNIWSVCKKYWHTLIKKCFIGKQRNVAIHFVAARAFVLLKKEILRITRRSAQPIFCQRWSCILRRSKIPRVPFSFGFCRIFVAFLSTGRWPRSLFCGSIQLAAVPNVTRATAFDLGRVMACPFLTAGSGAAVLLFAGCRLASGTRATVHLELLIRARREKFQSRAAVINNR